MKNRSLKSRFIIQRFPAAGLNTISSKIKDKENFEVLHLNWRRFGKKKFAFADRSFTTNEAKDCSKSYKVFF